MLTMQAGTSGAVAVVDVTGVIGWDDAQCLEFADKLKAAANQGASSITLRVNSPGGDVFSALSMYDAIRSCKIPVRAEVHGLAASAASLLCMAADTVAMSESAKFMVHQPYAGVWGNPDEIMNYAAMLIKERERMFAIYGGKCGKSWEQVSNDHKASVYYSAAEAIAYALWMKSSMTTKAPETVRTTTKKTPETKTTNPQPPRKPATMTKKTTKALQGKKGTTKTKKPPRRQA